MKLLLSALFFFLLQQGYAQVVLDADGVGNTYELISSIFAPGHNPIEVPDCNHEAFGEHIDEIFDSELNDNVFQFHIHTLPDNDRCIIFDRQRNEIKTYDQSPDNLLGTENEKVIYKWKFKLAAGFQSSPNFTHLHQLKPVGGSLTLPMYTLTTRKSSPDRLELRYVETDDAVTLAQTDLAPFIDTWLDVTETITYGIAGTYQIEIKRVSDGTMLFDYSNDSIVNWRTGVTFVRPKWGIYRSLLNAQDLRDETVLFANFSIEEIDVVSTSENSDFKNESQIVFSNPVANNIYIKSIPEAISKIQVFDLQGKKVREELVQLETELNIDVASLSKGIYVLKFIGRQIDQSALILINN